MSRSDRGALLLLALLGVGLVLGTWRLFALRFSAGDVFPAYSSLRADPLGTKILFESLGVAGVRVERGYRPLGTAGASHPAGTTVFFIGAARHGWDEVESRFARELEGAVANGARLVIAFHPEGAPAGTEHPPEAARRPTAEPSAPKRLSLPRRWGFRYGFAALRAEEIRAVAPGAQAEDGVDEPALWHSTLVFADLDASWRVRGSRQGRAVFIERDYGAGSIVLLADSYPLSNEAMLRDRRPGLLSRLVGPHGRVLFDEAHLGVLREPGGIVSLIMKYRLGGLALGLAVLAALFLWRLSSPFLPPREDRPEGEGAAEGRGASAALVDLVRRHVPPAELPAVCLREWGRTFPERRRRHPERFARAQAEAERCRSAPKPDPAGTCRRIARILKGA